MQTRDFFGRDNEVALLGRLTKNLVQPAKAWITQAFRTLCNNEKLNIPDPIEIQTLRIGDFAAQIENDLGGLIPGTMAEGVQRNILRLVVGSNFSWVFRRGKIKIKVDFLW